MKIAVQCKIFTQDRFIGLYCTSPKKKYLSQTLSTFSFSMMIWILNTQNGFIWIPVFRCHCFLVLLKYLLDHLNFKLWLWGWLQSFFFCMWYCRTLLSYYASFLTGLFFERLLSVTFQTSFRVTLIFLVTKKIFLTKVINYMLNLNIQLQLC